MELKMYHDIVKSAWLFFRKWLEQPPDWDAIVTEANDAVKPYRDKPGGKFAAELFTAAVSELERVKV